MGDQEAKECRLATADCGLGVAIGDWRFIADWRLLIGDWL
jgi:hypothetical protein